MLVSFIVFVTYLSFEKNENKQKRPGLAHFLKKKSKMRRAESFKNRLERMKYTFYLPMDW